VDKFLSQFHPNPSDKNNNRISLDYTRKLYNRCLKGEKTNKKKKTADEGGGGEEREEGNEENE
jgi:hypothetical protein